MLFSNSQPEPEKSDSSLDDKLANGNPQKGSAEAWSNWLDRNQRESWQMELLVSGFVIFLCVSALAPLEEYYGTLKSNAGDSKWSIGAYNALYLTLSTSLAVVSVSLTLGVMLRGLWIAGIGVRSFSGDINYEQLKLAPKFEQFLKRRIPPFDTYLGNLERLCSSVFAFTVLGVFGFMAIILVFVFIGVLSIPIVEYAGELTGKSKSFVVALLTVGLIALTVLSLGLIYGLDFLFASKLKRSKSLAAVYYPLYRFFGWITLARIYRPLYYNLIDNKTGRNLVLLILPFVVVIVALLQFNGTFSSPLVPTSEVYGVASSMVIHDNGKPGRVPRNPYLTSSIALNRMLPLFVPITGNFYERAELHCDSLAEISNDHTYKNSKPLEAAASLREYTTCLQDILRVEIDGEQTVTPDLIFTGVGKADVVVLQGLVPIDSLQVGSHLLSVGLRPDDQDTVIKYLVTIPFLIP